MGLRSRIKKLGRSVLGSPSNQDPSGSPPVPPEATPAVEEYSGVVEGKLLKGDGSPYELLLYKFDSCPYARRVMRCIDELGLEVERRDTRTDIEAMRSLRDLTGRTQVPCLVIDGEPMLESADIVRWLRQKARG